MVKKEEHASYVRRKWRERINLAICKLGGKCAVCGAKENLEFDHIDHNLKSFNVSESSVSGLRFWEELKKCQLLCKKHHAEKTKEEESWRKSWTNRSRLIHGSKWTYKHHKCRCDICVEEQGPKIRGRYSNKDNERKHGERRTYVKECRCVLCKKANSNYSKLIRDRKNKDK